MNELKEIFYLSEIETKEEDGRLRFRGKCQEADLVNANKRVYPYAILSREVAKLQTDIAEKRVLMQADHPASGRPSLQDTVGRVDKLEWGGKGGKSLYLEGTLLNTAKGKDVREVMKSAKIGLSSRGVGKTTLGTWQGQKADIVNDDFSLKTFDLVVGGSVRNAEVTVLREWREQDDFDTSTDRLTEAERGQLEEALESLDENSLNLLNRWLEEFTDETIGLVREKLGEEEIEVSDEDAGNIAINVVGEVLGTERAEELGKVLVSRMQEELQRKESENLTEEQKAQQRLVAD